MATISSSSRSEPASIDDFVHLPLDLTHSSIRILKILPGLPDDAVSCQLKHVPR